MANQEEEIIRDDAGSVLLRTMEDGTFLDAIGIEVRRTVLDLRQKAERDGRRMKGSIAIKIDLVCDPNGVLESEGDIVAKLPKVKRMRSIHWTRRGRRHHQSPRGAPARAQGREEQNKSRRSRGGTNGGATSARHEGDVNEMENTQDIGSLLEFAEQHLVTSEVIEVEQDGIEAKVLLTRDEGGTTITTVKSLVDPLRTRPERRKGCIEVDDLDSFVYLVNRDKLDESVIFSGRDTADAPYVEAILDFHEAAAGKATVAEARFCENRIAYGFPLSTEWKLWNSKNGEGAAMKQGTFAQFIEDHIFDIGEPASAGAIAQAFALKLGVHFASPSALMAVSRGLEVRSDQRVKESRNLENGDCSIVFEVTETDKHGGALNIPSAFHILIPIFMGGPLYSIPVRLRRRTSSGLLVWWIELHRADLFLNDAIEDSLKRVRLVQDDGGTGLPVVMGTPPS